ncbi:MAG: alpha/beta hydrolase [Pyramidobacter sp.]
MAVAYLDFLSAGLRRPFQIFACIPTDKQIFHGESRNGVSGLTPIPARKPLRTLYLLNGLRGDARQILTLTNVEKWAEVYHLCIVLIGGENRFYSDSRLTGDNYGQLIGRDVVEFTRETFNLSDKREDTYIGGFSMGGFGATVNGLRYPETFSRIMAFSSGYLKDMILSTADGNTNQLRSRSEWCSFFGLGKIEDFVNSDCDYEYLAEKVAAEKRQFMPRFFMCVGRNEEMYKCNNAYKEKLVSLGYDVTFETHDLNHDYTGFDASLQKALAWLPPQTDFVESRRAFSPNRYKCWLPLYSTRYPD